jgi:hypothetical protein
MGRKEIADRHRLARLRPIGIIDEPWQPCITLPNRNLLDIMGAFYPRFVV